MKFNALQGSAAKYARCGGIFNIRLTAKYFNINRLRFDTIYYYDHESVAPLFLSHPVYSNFDQYALKYNALLLLTSQVV